MPSRTVRQPVPPTRDQMYIILSAAIFLLIAGGALTIFGGFFLRDANVSVGWPATTGRIQNVRVTWDRVGTAGATQDREYYYVVAYSYTVAGQSYSGNRYSLGNGSNAAARTFNSEAAARAAADANYTPARDIPVHYDPNDPTQAVLQPGVNWGTYVPLILGAFFLLCGGMLLWLLFMRMQQATSHAA